MSRLLLLLFWALFSPAVLLADNLEYGGGLLSIYGNHYRGSDQSKIWNIPMPYFTYTSNKLEAETSFIRGIFYKNDFFAAKLSFSLGLNSQSKDNIARSGMPSLDYTFELGPMFVFYLWHSIERDIMLNFEFPLRKVYGTDLTNAYSIGYFTIPYLNLISLPRENNWNIKSEFSIGPMFADQNYHQYFYGVENQFVTNNRQAYHARGGYSGFQTALVLHKKIGKAIILPFIRWDNLNHAAFIDSPLVKVKNYTLGGIGLFWLFN